MRYLQQQKDPEKRQLSCWTLEQVHEFLLDLGATRRVAVWFLSEETNGYAMQLLWDHIRPFSELAPDMYLSNEFIMVLYAALAVLMVY